MTHEIQYERFFKSISNSDGPVHVYIISGNILMINALYVHFTRAHFGFSSINR